MGNTPLDDTSLDTLFREARSYSYWQEKEVSDEQIQAIYDLLKMGPTGVNSTPARFVFIKSDEGKELLKPSLAEGNVSKAMSAPVVAVIAWDSEFYTKLERLWPHQPEAREWYEGKPEKIESVGKLNGTLQAAYLIMAARSLGLDCGPMSGFDNDVLDKALFPDGKWRSNIICAIGYGVDEKLHPRGPRLEFNEACKIL
ncbi:MAG: malonic semialdehyde reductase [Gammaproteobacteria bacterium]|nr:malonic semialdehyde reductase [Gammaproteobacteria bacterium]